VLVDNRVKLQLGGLLEATDMVVPRHSHLVLGVTLQTLEMEAEVADNMEVGEGLRADAMTADRAGL
jgi:hypothetical protein